MAKTPDFHQIFELSDPAYQQCHRIFVVKTSLWEAFRAVMRYYIHEDWHQIKNRVTQMH